MPKSSPPSRPDPYQSLNAEIDKIARRKSPDAYSLITSGERQIRQFRLDSTISVETLLNEAYLRAIDYLDQGGIINNPKAWLRKTMFNIVRERSRQQRRQQPTDPQSHILEIEAPETAERCAEELLEGTEKLPLADRWKIFQEALEELLTSYPEQGRILQLRLIEKLSWEEVRHVILAEEGDAPALPTLRKQGSRAKGILRQLYHQREDHLYLIRASSKH
jgi:DNA-directed RNA polymerase specialized sigma24 family protein